MGTYQNDWLVTGRLAHTRYIPRYIGYVTEGGFRVYPKFLACGKHEGCAIRGMNRLAFQETWSGLAAERDNLLGAPPDLEMTIKR